MLIDNSDDIEAWGFSMTYPIIVEDLEEQLEPPVSSHAILLGDNDTEAEDPIQFIDPANNEAAPVLEQHPNQIGAILAQDFQAHWGGRPAAGQSNSLKCDHCVPIF